MSVVFENVLYNLTGATISSQQLTQATTKRTVPQREAEIQLNVMDFGAKGDGSQDDTTFIQNAINAAPVGGTWGDIRTVIYFPTVPYGYVIGGLTGTGTGLTYTFRTNAHSIIFRGQGLGSVLRGNNFPGFLIDRPGNLGAPAANFTIDGFENLQFYNNSNSAAAGCLRWNEVYGVYVRNCEFTGYTGVVMNNAVFGAQIDNCRFTGPGFNGNQGLQGSQGVSYFYGYIDNGAGSPGNTLTVTSICTNVGGGFIGPTTTVYPGLVSSIAGVLLGGAGISGTPQITANGTGNGFTTGTYTISGAAQKVNSLASPGLMFCDNPTMAIYADFGGGSPINNCDFVGYGEAVRCDSGSVVSNSRFEENLVGIRVGALLGAGLGCFGTSFEANTTCIQLDACQAGN